jgi:glycolate oxidase iron-sulfur subunit
VDYAHLFEAARAEVERSGVLNNPTRSAIRSLLLRGLFTRPRWLRLAGRLLWIYQACQVQKVFRLLRLTYLLPKRLRALEAQTPTVQARFSCDLIRPVERPEKSRYRVGMLTGCVNDILFSHINRDTVDVLLANGCEVVTPGIQPCCGSLHAHNGCLDSAASLARRLIDAFDVEGLDAIITNAAGCGSHLKTYGRLLADDPAYAGKAAIWTRKLKDIHEWLVECGIRKPELETVKAVTVTYHEACHLCHGQKITKQPREVLRAVPGLKLIELPESTWCCGSAGVYNITQPETATLLQDRKMKNILSTGAKVVVTSNPGCHLQLVNGIQRAKCQLEVLQPVSLLAEAYRAEKRARQAKLPAHQAGM